MLLKKIYRFIFSTIRRYSPRIAETDDDIGWCLAHGFCPDCGSNTLWGGPEGGLGRNLLCNGCGHEFNYCRPHFGGHAYGLSHRNSEQFDPSRNWAFKLPDDWKPLK